MTERDIITSIHSNEVAMSTLPEDVRKGVDSLVAKWSEYEANLRKWEKEHIEVRERFRQEQISKYLCKGTWGEHIPLKKRFCLCSRFNRGGEEREFCAIDVVRGFTSPYWGYYSSPVLFYNNRILPIFEANSDDALCMQIENNWDFFKISEDEMDEKFCIVDYEVSEDGEFSIVGESPMMTLKQHQEVLRKQYSKT